ncbi:MAG: molybdopterin molybdotransferase MoeA [Firmicutes bacterium]|nr:molybdopterin molybdotransferase MoeA [Bacillota bacterium]
MISLEKARKILDDFSREFLMASQKVESVPLWEAGGRILAVDIIAHEDAPAFNRSHVDGYALLSADTCGAAANNPVTLEIIDTIAAGSYSRKKLLPGTAMKIFTGAPLPMEADCIIKKEETREIVTDCGPAVIIKRPVSVGENISRKGEDISAGDSLFGRGTTISPLHMEILATLGIDPVSVFVKPRIGVFSTGNELVDVHEEQLQFGQLRASNLYALAEIIRQAGGIPVNLGLVRDRVDNVVQVYEKASRLKLPIIISTGGTAFGDFDVIKDAMEKILSVRLFNKVAMRPGAPFVASVRDNQLLIGLSGNPGGAIVAMLMIIYPIISRLAGGNKHLLPGRGKLTVPIVRKEDSLRGFFWGRCNERDGRLYVTPLQNQFCGAIETHINSNCLIEVPAGKVKVAENEDVDYWKLP